MKTSIKSIDQIDLLREQQQILSGEVALHSSALKRLSEEAANNPEKDQIQGEIKRLKDEMKDKNKQIDLLEKQIADSFITSDKMDQSGVSQNLERGADHGIAASRGDAKLNAAAWMSENMGGLKLELGMLL
ncbi:hypothetical protein QN277_009140 [Acacia crassicarpa]|uniref:Uncharacterized protein n=1 Tax=Acacia crassicarpa TaxID=499986 RepID=A0AAE1MB95_9FABA|nr:hypothetical protein QN277_009140 [Acacia crassicarpa]